VVDLHQTAILAEAGPQGKEWLTPIRQGGRHQTIAMRLIAEIEEFLDAFLSANAAMHVQQLSHRRSRGHRQTEG
jgi:hypothetical protein